jgi:hypothetical protein
LLGTSYHQSKGTQMNRKLKALSAIFSAALLAAAVSVVSAPAETGGHFISEVAHTELSGAQESGFNELHDAIGSVLCEEASFTGTTTATTHESISIIPKYGKCRNGTNTVTVDMNECYYTFTVGKKAATGHNTVHLICPPGKSITLTIFLEHTSHTHTPACTVHIPAQTPTGGVTYTTTGSGKTHGITADITVTNITVIRTPHFFGGCLFAAEHGTTAELTGKATLQGKTTAGEPVGITAT